MQLTEHVVVADVGGTQLRVGIVNRDGVLSGMRSVPTRAQEGRDAVMSRLIAELRQTIAEASGALAVGLSMAGPTDPDTGRMYDPPNLPGWDGFSPKAAVEERLAIATFAANDATLGALAEHRYGAGRGTSHMIFMTVSTGIGAGFVIDGRLYAGSRGFAGEVGHMTIDRNGPPCLCGNRGCLEVMASGTAVGRMARERLAAGEVSALSEMAGGEPDAVDAAMVAEAASKGDTVAVAVMSEVATTLGVGLVNILTAFDPEAIVIGGGMANSLDLLMPGIAHQIETHSMAQLRDRVPIIRRSELGNDVSLLGAAALAFEGRDG